MGVESLIWFGLAATILLIIIAYIVGFASEKDKETLHTKIKRQINKEKEKDDE